MTLQQNQSEAEQLDDLFVTFARTLLSHMEEWATTEQVPLTYHLNTDFYEDVRSDEPDSEYVDWHHEREEKRDYRAMLNRHGQDPLWRKEEVQACIQCWKARIGKPYSFDPSLDLENPSIWIHVPTGAIASSAYMLNELVTPILDLVERHNTLNPTREQLLESLHKFTDKHTAPYILWDISIPLLSFRSNLQHEEILGSFRLAPFSIGEKADTWNAFDNAPIEERRAMPVHIGDFAGAAFHLTYTRTVQRDVYEKQPYIFERIEKLHAAARGDIPLHLTAMVIELNNIITALRLVKSGSLEALGIFERLRTGFPVGKADLIYVLNNRRRHQYGNTYFLNEADLPAIRRCFDQLQSLHLLGANANQSQGQLSVALRRFNQAYERDLCEDRIILERRGAAVAVHDTSYRRLPRLIAGWKAAQARPLCAALPARESLPCSRRCREYRHP